MALRTNAKYHFGLPFVRIMPLNDDITIPTVSRIIGGTGPFDFSGVSDTSAVEIKVKIDDGDESSFTFDISAASDESAATVAEVVSALDTAFTSESLDLDASSATVNGSTRLKIENTNTASVPDWIQIYGEGPEILKLGMGFGLKFLKFDTMQTFGVTPTMVEDEDFTTVDANGKQTKISTDGYPDGVTATIVDTAIDPELKVLVMGGSYNSTTGIREAGTSESTRYYFFVEMYFPYYSKGTNNEGDLVGYIKKLLRKCKGTLGDDSHAREWTVGNYNLTGFTYIDEDGDENGAEQETELTIAAYNALSLSDV